jgi:3-oxoacyl-[acyl-carrier-protein] synthase II
MMAEPIVITGIGAISPIGNDVESIWKNLINGKSGISNITRFDASSFSTRIAGELKGFDPSSLGSPKELRRMDRLSWHALAACSEAINQSGLETSNSSPERSGVFWASGNGGMETVDQGLLEYANNQERPRFSPYFQSKVLVDAPSGWIAQRHNFKGPNFTAVAACASSNVAIMSAMLHLQAGLCDVALTGGSEAPISPSVVGGFSAMKALSHLNETPELASRPFAADRGGFVLAEGGAALVLETLSHALNRNAPILAVLAGCGNANDAGHPTSADPEGIGSASSIKMALKMANLKHSEISAINPHATSTPTGDLAEYHALCSVFGKDLSGIPVFPTKCMTGHLLGAAGALEAVIAIKCLLEQLIPGTINIGTIDPHLESIPLLISGKSESIALSHVLSHSAGFGGHNASVIFSKYDH